MVDIMNKSMYLSNSFIELQYDGIYCRMFMLYYNNIFNLGRKLTWIQIWFSFQVLFRIQSAKKNGEQAISTPESHPAVMGK